MPVYPGDMGIKSWSYEILVVSDGVDSWEECEDCILESGGDPEEASTYMELPSGYTLVELVPITADTELDRNPRCEKCGYVSFIFSPTAECIDEWNNQLLDYVRNGRGDKEYLDRVAEQMPWVNGDDLDEMTVEMYREHRQNEGE